MSKCSNLGALVLGILGLFGTTAAAQEIPPFTPVVISTAEAINSRSADVSRYYRAVLDEDLVVNGAPLARKGDDVLLRIVQVEQAQAVSGRAALTLQLAAISMGGQMRPVTSVGVTSTSGSQGAKAAKSGVGGAAVGAVIGGLLGGAGGAVKGGTIGASGGVAAAALTGQRVQVAKETRLTFTTGNPLTPNTGGPSTPGAPVAMTAAAGAPITVVESNQIRFEFAEAKAAGDELTVSLWATNNGVDRTIRWRTGGPGSVPVTLVDQTGSTYEASMFMVGNQQIAGPVVNGIRTPLTFSFKGVATLGGKPQASVIKRLQVPLSFPGVSNFEVELRELPIGSDAAAVAAPASPGNRMAVAAATASAAPVTVAESNQIRFEFAEARAAGDTLTVSLWATNNGVDRIIRWRTGGPGSVPATIVDETGSTYEASAFTVGNQQSTGPVVNGIRTPLTLNFKGIATLGGKTQANLIKRLQIPLNFPGASNFEVELRDLPIQK